MKSLNLSAKKERVRGIPQKYKNSTRKVGLYYWSKLIRFVA